MISPALIKSWFAPEVLADVARMGSLVVTAHLPRPLVQRLQARRLADTLRHAVLRSPFHRRRLADLSITAESIGRTPLEALPPMTKEDLRDNLGRIGTEECLRGDRLRWLLESPDDPPQEARRLEVVHTSGSTSKALHVVYDRAAWATARAMAMSRAFKPPAFPHRPTRVAYLGGVRGRLGGVRFASSAPRGLVEFLPLDVHAPFSDVAAAVERFSPDVFGGYPSAVALMAEEQLAGRVHLDLRRVVTSAEPLTPGVRATIRSAFGIEPVDFYASTESLALGASCHLGRGLHLFSDWHVFEVVNGDLEPLPSGRPGTLLVTNLYNRAMPLIRYRLGDEVVLSPDPCPCGSPFPLVERVAGRSEDLLWLQTNDGVEDFIHPVMMVDLGELGADRVKVVQLGRGELEIRLQAPENPAWSERAVRRKVEALLRSKSMDRSVRFDVRSVSYIPPDPRTGKFRFIEARPH